MRIQATGALARKGRLSSMRQSTLRWLKFLSLEPLLGPLKNLNLRGIDWAIAGGESAPTAHPMNPDWVRLIRDQCLAAGIAFHFKQWGGTNKKKASRMLDGRTWGEQPTKYCGQPKEQRQDLLAF
jgi:protein gp37